MLTVKCLDPNGTSSITQTMRVDRDTDNTLFWKDLEGHQNSADNGTVYVMNDDGRTIAQYEMSRPPSLPQARDGASIIDGG